MKALSIRCPYSHEIFTGVKNIEYRSWQTSYRGDLLICSSAAPKINNMVPGHAIIVCKLDGIEYVDDCYEWYLTGFRYIKPFKVRGKLGLYNVDDKLIEYIDRKEATEIYNNLAYKNKKRG